MSGDWFFFSLLFFFNIQCYTTFTVQLELWLLEIETICIWLQCSCSSPLPRGDFPPPRRRSHVSAAAVRVNTKDSRLLHLSADSCEGLLCCFGTALNATTIAHVQTALPFMRSKPTHLPVSPSPPAPRGVCTFPKRTGWQSFVPRNVFTSLPDNALTHALMHAKKHTRTPAAYIPLASALLAMPSAPVGRASSSQPRRGTFGSSFSGKNKEKIKQKRRMFFSFFVIFCFVKSSILEICLGLKRRSM